MATHIYSRFSSIRKLETIHETFLASLSRTYTYWSSNNNSINNSLNNTSNNSITNTINNSVDKNLHRYSSMGSHKLPLELDASRLIVAKKMSTLFTLPPLETLKFGQFFSDHMLDIDWDINNGWHTPIIKPLESISLHPGSSGLHYGLEVFEGIKAFKSVNGEISMFRPDLNICRLNESARRMALPTFDSKALIKLISVLLKTDEHLIPSETGYSMYIRPILFSTHPNLGVSKPMSAKLNVMLSPCGPYFPSGFSPVQLLAETRFTRAFPGGVGDCKAGGNYGPTIYPHNCAIEAGYSQILWLYPQENDHILTEVGTMNLFIYWINNNGEKELTTAPLEQNLILPGVVRDSVLTVARSWNEFKVSERFVWMRKDFVAAAKENRILEVFGTGTAAVVCPIDEITYEGVKYKIPLDKTNPEAGIGSLTKRLLESIHDIQYGRVKHDWSMPIECLINC